METEQCDCLLQEQISLMQFGIPSTFDIFGAALCNISVEDFQLLRHLIRFFTDDTNNSDMPCIRTYPYPISLTMYKELQSRIVFERKISFKYENGTISARYDDDSN